MICIFQLNDCLLWQYARVAQLVEYDLAKVGVAGSSPVSRSFYFIQKENLALRRILFFDKMVSSRG